MKVASVRFRLGGSESGVARFQAHSKSELMLPSKCTTQSRLIILKNS